jgi:hypothetical protein
VITSHIKGRRTPHVLAIFSYRYDAHLVPALIANVEPLVDGWVAYDDREARELFSNEGARRTALLTAAKDAGARWALAVDPDERFEAALAEAMPRLTAVADARAYTFALREMYGPDRYRVDGVWGRKRQARLLPIGHGVTPAEGELHVSWSAFTPGARLTDTPFNLYHLKMITAERRRARAALYRHLDPERRMQPIGYDYLADDRGARLEQIPPGRDYHPPHEDDAGLWMPPVPPP